jgi:hypothetical protein
MQEVLNMLLDDCYKATMQFTKKYFSGFLLFHELYIFPNFPGWQGTYRHRRNTAISLLAVRNDLW